MSQDKAVYNNNENLPKEIEYPRLEIVHNRFRGDGATPPKLGEKDWNWHGRLQHSQQALFRIFKISAAIEIAEE